MFERYNIDDLFLAIVHVTFPEHTWDPTASGIEMTGPDGYKYLTIVKKDNDTYIDLQYMSRTMNAIRNPKTINYKIEYMQPLSKYYTQDGRRKQTFSKRKALLAAKEYYVSIYLEYLKQPDEKSLSKVC